MDTNELQDAAEHIVKRFLEVCDLIVKQKKEKDGKYSHRQLMIACGFNLSLYNKINKGIQEPQKEHIQKLQKIFNVNPDWIYTGKGDMFKEPPVKAPEILLHLNGHDGKETDDSEEVDYKELDVVDLDKVKRIKIPIVEIEVAASFVQNVDGQYTIDDVTFEKDTIIKMPGIKYDSLSLVFKIRGDSMTPNYRPGEMIYANWVDPDWWDTIRDVCVISMKNGSLILKRIVASNRSQHTITLRPDNDIYGEVEVSLVEIQAMWRMEYFVLAHKR